MESTNYITNNQIKLQLGIPSAFRLILFFLLFSDLTFGQSSQTKTGVTYAAASIAGSVGGWSGPANAISSNDVYAIPTANMPNNGDYTDYLKITNFQFTIPTGSVITGIAVNVERSDANGKSKDSEVKVIKAGSIGVTNKALSPAWGGTDAVQTYGANGDIWGNTWAVADINATNFGFAFSAKRVGGGGQATLAKIDEVIITVYYTTPLPIDLIYFRAQNEDKSVDLFWETATETNNDFFTIERSLDGINFESIANIKGAENSSIALTYQFTDTNPLSGTSYYRLKQTDYDGQSELFNSVAVNHEEVGVDLVNLQITSSIFSESFTITFNQITNELITISLFDLSGHSVYSSTNQTTKGYNAFTFSSIELLKSGTYILILRNENKILAATKVIYSN